MSVELVFTPNYVLAHKLISEATFWHQKGRLINSRKMANHIKVENGELKISFGANTLNLTNAIEGIVWRVSFMENLMVEWPDKRDQILAGTMDHFYGALNQAVHSKAGDTYNGYPIENGYFIFGTTWVHVPTLIQLVLKHFNYDQFLEERFWVKVGGLCRALR